MAVVAKGMALTDERGPQGGGGPAPDVRPVPVSLSSFSAKLFLFFALGLAELPDSFSQKARENRLMLKKMCHTY